MLDQNLCNTNESVKAIKKANSIDYKAMIGHFHNEITSLQNCLNFNIRLEMDPQKREAFRTSLNSLVGIRNTN